MSYHCPRWIDDPNMATDIENHEDEGFDLDLLYNAYRCVHFAGDTTVYMDPDGSTTDWGDTDNERCTDHDIPIEWDHNYDPLPLLSARGYLFDDTCHRVFFNREYMQRHLESQHHNTYEAIRTSPPQPTTIPSLHSTW